MKALPGTRLVRWSPIYLSEPVGFSSTRWFFNLVAEIETALSPWALVFRLWQIELSQGRKRSGEVADRPLDLDLLLYEDVVLEFPSLTLPHPRMHERLFVLRPLCDLWAWGRHPVLKKSFQELAHALKDQEDIFFLTFVEP